jgi:hypothetical protein
MGEKVPVTRNALFWVTKQQAVVISEWRFGTTYLSHLRGSRLKKHTQHWHPEKHRAPMAGKIKVVKVVSLFHTPCLFMTDLPQKQDNIWCVKAVSNVFPVRPIFFDSAASKHYTMDIHSYIHWDTAVCCVSEIIRNMALHRLMSKEPLEDMKWYYATEQEIHCILSCHYCVSCNFITMYPVSVIHSHLRVLWRKKT